MESRNHGIIKIIPIPAVTSITWMLSARCNYDCMYCPADIHDNTSKHPDLDKLKTIWESIYEKTKYLKLPYKVAFSGGEVTANKNFLPILEHIKNGNFNVKEIYVSTNGSASLNYYKKLAKLVNGITFSTHTEFFDESKFFPKVLEIDRLMIRPEKSVHVSVMNERWAQDRTKLYCDWLEKHNISHALQSIDYSKNTRDWEKKEGKLSFDFAKK